MDPITLAMLGISAASTIGGMFGRDTSNPNAQFGDINSPYYQVAQQQYFNNLRSTLNASSPGTQSLLALGMSRGADYGGSSYIANKQRQNIMTHNTDAAVQGSQNFLANLYSRNAGIYAEGNMAQFQDQNSFSNNLIGLGGGLIGKYFNQGNGQTNFGSNSNGYGSSFTQPMFGNVPPTMNNIPAPSNF